MGYFHVFATRLASASCEKLLNSLHVENVLLSLVE